MKVSVVTATRNAACHLDGNIRSVLAQRHKDFEHIVIDGASSDGSIELLQTYRHLTWTSESDAGVYSAINKGLAQASGEVITYLNADDRYYDYTLHEVCRAFEADGDLDFVYGDCTYINERQQRLFTLRPLPYVRTWLLGARVFWAQPACFWRRRVHDRIGYLDTTLHNAADYDFFARMVHSGLKGRRIPRTLALFMRRPDCASEQQKDRMRREIAKVTQRYGLLRRPIRYMLAELAFAIINAPSAYWRIRLRLGIY